MVLNVYHLPYNPLRPVVCIDERPCFLIDDVLMPIPTKPGKVAKEDYEYEKCGQCTVFYAIEPLTGKRVAQVSSHRTAKEYTEFMQKVEAEFPEAEKIIAIQDNLNIHHGGSFYKFMEPDEAFKLAEKFEWVHTPKHASWLNMVEIEFSAMSRQCLNRRIAKEEVLRREIEAWSKNREANKITLKWQFSADSARKTFANSYKNIRIN